ncbi:hypothetical protein Tco_0594234 [Tanacetum coccineum]|uniref:Uncharacterized protein n=1 Tax=Tanacetum coccineum TaxID=301880 RepID=A0ABQ5APT8_9ASTR
MFPATTLCWVCPAFPTTLHLRESPVSALQSWSDDHPSCKLLHLGGKDLHVFVTLGTQRQSSDILSILLPLLGTFWNTSKLVLKSSTNTPHTIGALDLKIPHLSLNLLDLTPLGLS